MGAETLRYAAVMLAAGVGIPILAALNAQLGARLGSPVAAGTVLFVVAFAAAATVLMLTGGPGPLRGQLLSAAIIDHFGLFGAMVKPFSLTRGAGIGLMAMGVLLTQRA